MVVHTYNPSSWEDCCRPEASLVYIASSGSARAISKTLLTGRERETEEKKRERRRKKIEKRKTEGKISIT